MLIFKMEDFFYGAVGAIIALFLSGRETVFIGNSSKGAGRALGPLTFIISGRSE
jgi:hypothetical protein